MRYLLDTNICIYLMKGDKEVSEAIGQINGNEIAISFITLSELYYGAYKSARQNENLLAVSLLASQITVIESNAAIAKAFGEIKTALIKKGRITDDADIFIAATAITNQLFLVTNNLKHFETIPQIMLENWKKS